MEKIHSLVTRKSEFPELLFHTPDPKSMFFKSANVVLLFKGQTVIWLWSLMQNLKNES